MRLQDWMIADAEPQMPPVGFVPTGVGIGARGDVTPDRELVTSPVWLLAAYRRAPAMKGYAHADDSTEVRDGRHRRTGPPYHRESINHLQIVRDDLSG